MSVNAKELKKYMTDNQLDKVVVEALNVNVPLIKNYQQPRVLAKRLVILSVRTTNYGDYPPQITYAMYNSFKRSNSFVPNDFQFEILPQAVQLVVLNEYKMYRDGLEKDFRDAYNDTHDAIQEKLKTARDLIKEAVKLSQDSGVPFVPPKNLLPVPDASYMPSTFKDKFGATDELYELASELTGANTEDSGWYWYNSSASC